jgi:hypothetical protein
MNKLLEQNVDASIKNLQDMFQLPDDDRLAQFRTDAIAFGEKVIAEGKLRKEFKDEITGTLKKLGESIKPSKEKMDEILGDPTKYLGEFPNFRDDQWNIKLISRLQAAYRRTVEEMTSPGCPVWMCE